MEMNRPKPKGWEISESFLVEWIYDFAAVAGCSPEALVTAMLSRSCPPWAGADSDRVWSELLEWIGRNRQAAMEPDPSTFLDVDFASPENGFPTRRIGPNGLYTYESDDAPKKSILRRIK